MVLYCRRGVGGVLLGIGLEARLGVLAINYPRGLVGLLVLEGIHEGELHVWVAEILNLAEFIRLDQA